MCACMDVCMYVRTCAPARQKPGERRAGGADGRPRRGSEGSKQCGNKRCGKDYANLMLPKSNFPLKSQNAPKIPKLTGIIGLVL